MFEVFVLFEGYSTQFDDVTMHANCSCVLIKSPRVNVIIDTMTAWDKQDILHALSKHHVDPKDIHYVVCTHSHADHIGNNNLFLSAREHIVGYTVQCDNLFHERGIRDKDYKLNCNKIIVTATPGHTAEDVTVLVNGKFKGEECRIAITGDLFEKEEDIDEPSLWMKVGVSDLKEVQATQRCRIADLADIIIPGHGPPFEVTDEIRCKLAEQLEQIKLNEL